MTIEYKIDENDYLTHQLFIASKSERIKRKRQRNKVFVSLVYVVIGFLFLKDGNTFGGILCFIVAVLWFFLFPIWERRYYINHYKGFINDNYKDKIGRIISLEFTNDYIFGKSSGSESKIMTTEMEEICEIPTTIFVRIKGGQSLILPKDKIADIDIVRNRLKQLAGYLNVKYDVDEKWEWK